MHYKNGAESQPGVETRDSKNILGPLRASRWPLTAFYRRELERAFFLYMIPKKYRAQSKYIGVSFGEINCLDYCYSRHTPCGTPVHYFLFRCHCGTFFRGQLRAIRSRSQKSCGCWSHAHFKPRITHGMTHSPKYSVWTRVKRRCYDATSDSFPNYGGRGIKMCQRWKDSFETFLEEAFAEYKPGLSIERINVNGDYEPGNITWIPMREQSINRRTTIWIECRGESKPLAHWCKEGGRSADAVKKRLNRGWTTEQAIFTPPNTIPTPIK